MLCSKPLLKCITKAKASAGKKIADREAIAKKLKAAVKAGKLTEKEAKAKWAAIKKAKIKGKK